MNKLNIYFLSSLLAIGLLPTSLSARTWTSSEDPTKTFNGKLKKYDDVSKKVTIIRTNGSSTSFSIEKLSEEDQKWIIESEASKSENDGNVDLEKLKEAFEANPLTKNFYSKLTQLNKKKLKKANLKFEPEYYLLYFSASW